MLRKTSRLVPNRATRSEWRCFSGGNKKTQSMFDALLSKPGKKVKRPKTTIRRPPPKEPARTSRPSFFSEVEQFLQKEKSLDSTTTTSTHRNPRDASAQGSKNALLEPYAPKKSIFDVFQVPKPPPPRNENAFEAEAYAAYEAILDAFVDEMEETEKDTLTNEEKEDVMTWLRLDEPTVEVKLPILTSACEEGVELVYEKASAGESLVEQVKAQLQTQEAVFKQELGWNDDQYKYATRLIHALTRFSHKNHKALPIVIIWEKMKETGYMQKKTIGACLEAATSFSGGILTRNRSSLLNISPRYSMLNMLDSNDASGQVENATDKEEAHRRLNVPEQLASVNDLLYEPTEQSSAIRTRRLLSLGDPDKALELIQERMAGEARLRAYSQVFSLYLELGNISSALHLMKKLQEGHKRVPLQPELFVQLLSCCAEQGYFTQGSDPINNISELGYSESKGPGLFNQLAAEMSLYVDSISSASAKRLQKAFKRGFNESVDFELEFDVSTLAPLKPLREPIADTDLVADRVSIDISNGYCVASDTSLRLIQLEKAQKRQMKRSLLRLVGKGGRQGRRAKELQCFWDWLNTRTGRPFTVVVDAPNIAYYMQNFDRGKFNFAQIQFVVTALENHGEFPLVLLPQKYVRNSFQVTLGTKAKVQTLDASERAIIEGLVETGMLYTVPQGNLDDYYWISATVAEQARCQTEDADEPRSNPKRLSSGAPVVVSNDQIRDHKEFDLLESKAFNRWYSNTIVNYNFTGFVGNKCVDPEIAFTPADKFSREIQGNKAGNNMMTWHFPVQDWETSDWFCIRIPDRKN